MDTPNAEKKPLTKDLKVEKATEPPASTVTGGIRPCVEDAELDEHFLWDLMGSISVLCRIPHHKC